MSQIDLEASVPTIKKYAKEEMKKRNERRRNSLSTNVPDDQVVHFQRISVPEMLPSQRNHRVVEMTKDVDEIDFRTYMIFTNVSVEQPLDEDTNEHKKNNKIAQDEASLIRREHA